MVGGDNARALIHGQSYISKATGTLGPSFRGKTPIWSQDGNKIIGVVSVGFLLEDIEEMENQYGKHIFWIAMFGLVIGVAGSIYLAEASRKHYWTGTRRNLILVQGTKRCYSIGT